MSGERKIRVSRRGAVLEITIDRPQVRNALDRDSIEALRAAFARAAAEHEVRAVVLTGEGVAFCAGGDLKSIFDAHGPLHIRRFLDLTMRPLIHAMMALDKPILAVLNGVVAGAGIGIAMAADMIIACEEASLVPAFGRIGAMPDSGTLYFLAQNIGMLRAKEIVMLNRTLGAGEAQALGLYNRVVPRERLTDESAALADELARGPTIALGLAKKALRDALRLPFDAFMDLESLSMALLISTEDQREGIAAFNEKRTPVFAGR
jgi:2-(1,2-epoxy-1,2-dihydrophenyl)acetyl-CoA isomerase